MDFGRGTLLCTHMADMVTEGAGAIPEATQGICQCLGVMKLWPPGMDSTQLMFDHRLALGDCQSA